MTNHGMEDEERVASLLHWMRDTLTGPETMDKPSLKLEYKNYWLQLESLGPDEHLQNPLQLRTGPIANLLTKLNWAIPLTQMQEMSLAVVESMSYPQIRAIRRYVGMMPSLPRINTHFARIDIDFMFEKCKQIRDFVQFDVVTTGGRGIEPRSQPCIWISFIRNVSHGRVPGLLPTPITSHKCNKIVAGLFKNRIIWGIIQNALTYWRL